MPAFMAELREQRGFAPRALELTILTACRTGEVLGARWDEIDLAVRAWVIPATRMKSGKPHRVPLSNATMALLEALPREVKSPFVFPGARRRRPLSNMALLMLLRRMGHGDVTAHGFRSSFRSWAAEVAHAPRELAEMCLAHAVGNEVEQAYMRGDMLERRRNLAASWAEFLENTAQA